MCKQESNINNNWLLLKETALYTQCSQRNVKQPNTLTPPKKQTMKPPQLWGFWDPFPRQAKGCCCGRCGRRAWVCLCSLKLLFNKHVKQTERQEGKGERRSLQSTHAADTGMKPHCRAVGKGNVLNSSLDLRSWRPWTRSDTSQLGSFNEFTLLNSSETQSC